MNQNYRESITLKNNASGILETKDMDGMVTGIVKLTAKNGSLEVTVLKGSVRTITQDNSQIVYVQGDKFYLNEERGIYLGDATCELEYQQ